jgi:hypothetical protein
MALSEVLVPESSVLQLLRLLVMRIDIHYDGLTIVIAIVVDGGDDRVVTGRR